jgi:glyoxylase-like metal-dependent hydrolase (beta-lactamase superfamily II)
MVRRWDIIIIGNLSRNHYWGEGDDTPVRSALCTCTLVQGADFRLIVDPSVPQPERMAAELDRRTGLGLADVTHVFLTHEHGDHHAGLACFPRARWMADPATAGAINSSGRYAGRVKPVCGRILEAMEVTPTPGHTASHHSLRFDCGGLSVVIAGDAVMTRDFWEHRRGFHNSVDLALAAETMERLAIMADVVVPGHDNCFLTATGPASRGG